MSNLSLPRERLAKYLRYLGLSYKELEAHYGIGHSTWQVAATSGKRVSSIILDALTTKAPPVGKSPPNISWLLHGTEPMILPTKEVQPGAIGGTGFSLSPIERLFEKSDLKNGLPEEIQNAIQSAVLMVEDFLGVIKQEKRIEDRAKKAAFIVVATNLQVAGRQEEIPGLMARLMEAFSRPAKEPPENPSAHPDPPAKE